MTRPAYLSYPETNRQDPTGTFAVDRRNVTERGACCILSPEPTSVSLAPSATNLRNTVAESVHGRVVSEVVVAGIFQRTTPHLSPNVASAVVGDTRSIRRTPWYAFDVHVLCASVTVRIS